MRGSTRILVVDDFAPMRRLVCSHIQGQPGCLVVGEAADGLEAVQMAKDLRPDLILMDIGLPGVGGIEAARRIRELVPESRILVLSQDRSWSIVEAALRSGAVGYVLKLDIGTELLPAVRSALRGGHYVSSSLGVHDPPHAAPIRHPGHTAGFYSDDQSFLLEVSRFVASYLTAGNSAVVIATEAHRKSLLARLQASGLDIGAAIEQGRYFALDAAEALSSFMLNGSPDPDLFKKAFGSVLPIAAEAAKGSQRRVGVFGEAVNLLCAEGNPQAAIQTEKLWNQLMSEYNMDLHCGYSAHRLDGTMDDLSYLRIRSEHSMVHCH